MSVYAFYLPDLGEGLQEAELVSWLVAVGDHVVEDQPLLSVETEKSLVEIPSPVAGEVLTIHGDSGQLLAVGTLLAEFEVQQRVDAGAIVGTLPVANAAPKPALAEGGRHTTENKVRAAPAVRAEARRRGIDLGGVSGSGRDGSITMADLDAPGTEAGNAQPLHGLRRGMARNMSAARHQVAHATVMGSADVESWNAGAAPLLRLVRAVIAACAQEPALNAWFDEPGDARTLHTQVHLGIATDTAEGLLVPTLRDAQQKTEAELGAELQQLLASGEQRSLAASQLTGQTITLSNFGAIAGEYAQMVVVPPQVAIVGAGRIQRLPVAVGDTVSIHARLPISISFDHRVVSGGEAARFLKALIADLEQSSSRYTNENTKENDND